MPGIGDMLQLVPQLLLAGRAYDLAVSAHTSSTLTLSFLYVPGAFSYEYSISSTSAVAGFGAWTALASDKIITGLAAATQYWVKLRIVNGVARGTASPVVTGTTDSGGLDTDTTAWINAVVAAGGSVSAPRQTIVNTLVTALKGHSLWTKCDRLWLLAAENTQQQTIDLRSLQSWTKTGTVTFTADQGAAGNGSTGFLSTGFIPSTAGGQFALNANSQAVYIRTSRTAGDDQTACGAGNTGNTSYAYIRPRDASGNLQYGTCDFNFKGAATANVQGFSCVTRDSATSETSYKNGSSLGNEPITTSVALPNVAMYICALNDGGVLSAPSTDQIALFWLGGSLDATQNSNLSADLNGGYMTSLGTSVY